MRHALFAFWRVHHPRRSPLFVSGDDPHVKTACLFGKDQTSVAKPHQPGRVRDPPGGFAATNRHGPRVPQELRRDGGVGDRRVVGREHGTHF